MHIIVRYVLPAGQSLLDKPGGMRVPRRIVHLPDNHPPAQYQQIRAACTCTSGSRRLMP